MDRDDARAVEPPARVATVEPLDADAFAPFGQVIGADIGPGRSVNLGTARRFDHAAALESARPGARPNLAVFRSAPIALPVRVAMLERHPHSTQAFLPLSGGRWLICVAPEAPGGGPDAAALRAFVGAPGRGVNLARGLWHHPILALDEAATFAMLAWEDGSAGDCEEQALARALDVGEP